MSQKALAGVQREIFKGRVSNDCIELRDKLLALYDSGDYPSLDMYWTRLDQLIKTIDLDLQDNRLESTLSPGTESGTVLKHMAKHTEEFYGSPQRKGG